MARPRKHYGKWRIRWVDEHRCRQSETFDTPDEADFAQQKHELEVKEVKRGLRGSIWRSQDSVDTLVSALVSGYGVVPAVAFAAHAGLETVRSTESAPGVRLSRITLAHRLTVILLGAHLGLSPRVGYDSAIRSTDNRGRGAHEGTHGNMPIVPVLHRQLGGRVQRHAHADPYSDRPGNMPPAPTRARGKPARASARPSGPVGHGGGEVPVAHGV
jgi:hypothetical protein